VLAGRAGAVLPSRDRDTRLTWWWVILVALAARMWHLIRLH
jgi:hypothetical protein